MVIHSPEDAATFTQWCRAVCLFYAAITLILVAVSVAQQLRNREDEARIASSLTLTPAVTAVRGEPAPQGR
jgi:hypothetical protein